MGKIKRGGYQLFTWIGDHPPKHVHVLKDGKLIVKWDLEKGEEMEGVANSQIKRIIKELQKEGLL